MYFKKLNLIILNLLIVANSISLNHGLCADDTSYLKERALIDSLISKKYLYQAYTNLETLKNRILQDVLHEYLPDSSNRIVNKYNEYFFLMLTQQPVTINEIQHTYLHEKEALLDFMVVNDHIHTFIITKDTFNIVTYKIKKDSLFHDMTALIMPMYNAQDPLHLCFDIGLAYQLYEQIFAPLENYLKNVRSLIIIPDDILLGFPFECLIFDISMKRNKKRNNVLYDKYKDANFLIKKYAMAYNFSTVALNPELQALRAKEKLGRKMLTMSELTGLSNENDTSGIGWNLQSLNYGHEEVHRVSRLLWRHKNLVGDQATTDYFKNNGLNFRWIYLAIPGMLNNINPKLSALIFSQIADSTHDNELNISEIINSKLRADLITLSGCELKPVQIRKKVGVLGIPQSFLLSGAQSVMFNLWRIHNITVSRFMAKFYWELKYKRQTNILALQQAKLSSIKDTFTYKGKEISRAHPYFWASFVLIGNVNIRPPTFSTIPPKMVILIMYIVVFTVSLIIVRKTIERK